MKSEIVRLRDAQWSATEWARKLDRRARELPLGSSERCRLEKAGVTIRNVANRAKVQRETLMTIQMEIIANTGDD